MWFKQVHLACLLMGSVIILFGRPILAKEVPQVSQPEKTSKDLIVQREGENVQVTKITLNQTPTGLEIIFETKDNQELEIYAAKFTKTSDSLIADIPNAILALPDVQEFIAENPTQEIAKIEVLPQQDRTIQVRVTGNQGVPTQAIILKSGDFGYAFNPDGEQSEDNIEVLATGERQQGYFVPNASTATRTDTPLIDIPQSIQVVPQQLIRDRNTTELEGALETVPGVVPAGGRGTSANGPNILIRGFDATNSIYRDGIPYFTFAPISTNDIERIEVLKGPASVLFGAGDPGGVINLVSKKPLNEPSYAISFTAGNFDSYRGDVDFSGPLNNEKTVKYRFNLSYEDYGSFRDFVEGRRLVVSPMLTWDISPNTTIDFYGQYVYSKETIDNGIPAQGTGIVNVPRERFLGEDFSAFEQNQFQIGYTFNHKFSENWSVRHALQYLQYEPTRFSPLFDSFDELTGELFRFEYATDGTYERFFTNAEVVGKFKTGPIAHQLLVGVDYRYGAEDPSFEFSDPYPSINVFNPVYAGIIYQFTPEFFRDDHTNRVGVYIQDQIDLLPNLKILAGVRYDYSDQFRTTRNIGEQRAEFSQTDEDFSPRVGIVYQPIPTVAIYGSYSTSFNPSFAASRNADNSTFDPETGEQFEVGVKADISDQFSITFSAFDIKKQNVSTPDPNNPLFSLQTGEQTSRGIELFLTGEILPGWNVVASYAYLDAYVSKDTTLVEGNNLANVPHNQFSLWTTYEIQEGSLDGLGFGLGLFYVDERPGDLDNTFTLPSYFRTDLAVFYRQDNWQLQLNVENLFDIEYFSSATFGSRQNVNPGAPFTVTGKVSFQF